MIRENIQDEGSDRLLAPRKFSAAAEFRIANYDAADIDQFVFFQS
jgi:hypothetical protein